METSVRKTQMEQFRESLKKTEGKSLIAMTHGLYGPLRGLNFILENTNPEEVFKMIEIVLTPMSIERQTELIKKSSKKGFIPQNMRELVIKVWNETMLSTIPQVLPFEMLDKCENTPETVSSISEGILAINKSLSLTTDLQKKDPFFFRMGII